LTLNAMNTLKGAMADQRRRGVQRLLRRLQFSIGAGAKPEQTVSANVSVFDQMTDDEQKTMLAALKALKDA
jgi:hypothetical protein